MTSSNNAICSPENLPDPDTKRSVTRRKVSARRPMSEWASASSS